MNSIEINSLDELPTNSEGNKILSSNTTYIITAPMIRKHTLTRKIKRFNKKRLQLVR